MRQIACHFCPLCDRLEAPITIPDNAHRLRVSVNCTPDDITWRSELDLEIFAEPPGIDRGDNLCSDKGPGGTAVACQLEKATLEKVAPDRKLYVKLTSGLLQQCQVVATVFDRAN